MTEHSFADGPNTFEQLEKCRDSIVTANEKLREATVNIFAGSVMLLRAAQKLRSAYEPNQEWASIDLRTVPEIDEIDTLLHENGCIDTKSPRYGELLVDIQTAIARALRNSPASPEKMQ